MIVSGVHSYYFTIPIYEANLTLLISKKVSNEPRLEGDIGATAANKQLVKTYGEIAKSRSVVENAKGKLGIDISIEELTPKISVETVSDTEIFMIKVKDRDPKFATEFANQIAVSLSNKIRELKNLDNINVVDWAILPTVPINYNKYKNVSIALVVGLMGALGIIFLLEFLDDTIKNQEDVETLLGIPVIGTVPDFHSKKLKGDILG